ncbi:MAG: cysteine desulfurase [Nanoarchaeota archaeon]|nr:cysteine desulfurase [Nanoarchaeota archaeon]|tara:strand:- start:753 stop:1922 length:1170 start_codon:yes stop_codon:yes gene_type:complete
MKSDFPLLNSGLVYLDNSSTTQKPNQVIQVINNFYKTMNANVHRGIYKLSDNATRAYQNARKTVASFINADEDELIFTSGTTQSLNMLARMIPLKEGDEILLTEMEHHSNIVPWQEVAKVKRCTVKFIPLKDYELDMDKAKELITEKTKVIAVTHMSNVLGTINPIKELAQLAHEVNALFVVDAAQSVAHLPIDVKELDCDFLAFSAHKMYGPTGIGALYGKKELLETMNPSVFGGGMINQVTKENSSFTNSPLKFEAGTPNIAGAIGFAAAVKYLEELGIEKIKEKENELSSYALEKLKDIPNLNIIGPTNNRGLVFSFTLDGIHPHDTAEILDKQNIAVRGGHHCAMPLMKALQLIGTTRISLGIYNSKEDIDKLIQTIPQVQEVFA